MKTCPYCAEEIQEEAIICRFCGQELAPGEVAQVRQGLSNETPAPKPQQPSASEAKGSSELLVVSQYQPEESKPLRPIWKIALLVGLIVGGINALVTYSQVLELIELSEQLGQPISRSVLTWGIPTNYLIGFVFWFIVAVVLMVAWRAITNSEWRDEHQVELLYLAGIIVIIVLIVLVLLIR